MYYSVLLLVFERVSRVVFTLMSTRLIADELDIEGFSSFLSYTNAAQLIAIFSLFGMREPVLANFERYRRSILLAFDTLFIVYTSLGILGLIFFILSGSVMFLLFCSLLAFYEFYYILLSYKGINIGKLLLITSVSFVCFFLRYFCAHFFELEYGHFLFLFLMEGILLNTVARRLFGIKLINNLHIKKSVHVITSIFRKNYHLFLAGLCVTLYTRLEFWFSTFFDSPIATVETGIGLRLAEMTALIPATIALGLSKVIYKQQSVYPQLLLFFLGCICASFFYFNTSSIIYVLYGDDYKVAINEVRIYLLSIPFIWIGAVMEKYFYKLHGSLIILQTLLSALLLSFIFNLVNVIYLNNVARPFIYVFIQSFACLWGYYIVKYSRRMFLNNL